MNLSHLKSESYNANGTYFSGIKIKASVENLRIILGDETYGPADDCDKVNYQWDRETRDGYTFTLYDWKNYEGITESEVIEWHIGAHSHEVAHRAFDELAEASIHIHSLTAINLISGRVNQTHKQIKLRS